MSKGTRKEGKKMTRKFKDHPYAQACVIECDDGYKALQSYDTLIAEVDTEGWLKILTLENPNTGELSRTTIRHLGWFMRELGLTYQLAKALYYDHKEYNIYTGEVIDCD